jgi:uncharacterized protein YecE (DUF72 family)
MQKYIGTSGWLYKDWTGRFYPETVAEADKLTYFAEHFSTVEVNSTFYHMPLAKSVERWFDVTPMDFTFTLKMNRYATHTKHLVADSDTNDTLALFFERAALLKQKLGMILVQLPPSMRVAPDRIINVARQASMAEKKYGMQFPLAIEFRHASWFTDEVFAMMRAHNVTHVINDSPNRWPAAKKVTSDTMYIRFHGNKRLYRSSYSGSELEQWAVYIRKSEVHTIFAYFNNDYDATAVRNARTLQEKLTR